MIISGSKTNDDDNNNMQKMNKFRFDRYDLAAAYEKNTKDWLVKWVNNVIGKIVRGTTLLFPHFTTMSKILSSSGINIGGFIFILTNTVSI